MTDVSPPSAPRARPRLVVSRCLDLDACRYNGVAIRAPLVGRLAAHVELVPVCPEVEVGLGVPRDPIRLVRGRDGGGVRLVQPSTGRDLTGAMDAFAAGFVERVGEVDGFLLKSRSPSCGIDDVKVYGEGAGAAPVGKDHGRFAAAVLEAFPDHPVEHEGRLTNLALRDHWLTALFAVAALREAHARGGMGELVAFHARHKLLLMASSPAEQTALGRIVAGGDGRSAASTWDAYAAAFRRALVRPPRPGTHVNVLQHAAGYFKDRLEPAEKAVFLTLLEDYRGGRVPRLAPLAVLRSWVARFHEPWLEAQAYLAPYPRPLMDLRDSGV